MYSDDTKIIEFNQYQKSDKASLIIYAVTEFLIKKIDRCKNHPENSIKFSIFHQVFPCLQYYHIKA